MSRPGVHRVFKTRYRIGMVDEVVFDIREVQYDDAGNIEYLGDYGVEPSGGTLEELREDIRRHLNATTWPVLTPADFPGYEYSQHEVPLEEET